MFDFLKRKTHKINVCIECYGPFKPTGHRGGKPQLYCSYGCKLQAEYRRRKEKRAKR